MSSRCLACDKRFSDEELLIADDFCKKCLRETFGVTSYKAPVTEDSDFGDLNDEFKSSDLGDI